MFSALLDTNVLWPSLQRDFLLSLAAEGLYRPLWSEAILDEVQEHEALKLISRGTPVDEATARAEYLIGEMRIAFDDAIVFGWENLEGTFGLPDPDDEHVLAAATIGGAGVIVTENDKDFPAALLPTGLEIQSARDFAAKTVSVDPARAARALGEIARRHLNPKHSPSELLDLLVARYAMDDVADLIEPLLSQPSDTRE
jgi:hypothetical protein